MIAKLLQEDHFLVKHVGMIGTRRITSEIEASVVANAGYATFRGYWLVSGGAKGVDTKAETVFRAENGQGIIFKSEDALDLWVEDPESYRFFEHIAKACHPNWNAVKYRIYVKNLMVRNAMIVWYSDIVLAWPSADRKGGTEHGINCAQYLGRPLEILS